MEPTEASTMIVKQLDLIQQHYDMPMSELNVIYQSLSEIMRWVIDHMMEEKK